MKTIVLAGVLLFSNLSNACPIEDETKSTLKNSSMNFFDPTDEFGFKSTVTAKDYASVFNHVKKVYTPIFKKAGFQLLLESNWKDKSLKAFATAKKANKKRRKIYVSGGHARLSFYTKETLYVTLCHEIGHHLGGYPIIPKHEWGASSEGQSDYYATSKCMKILFANDDVQNALVASSEFVPQFVKNDCTKQFILEKDQNLCVRLAMASEAGVKTLGPIWATGYGDLNDRDDSVIDKMDYEHPENSCRLQTMYQGALCNADPKVSFSRKEELTGACHPSNGNELGARPFCWFLPKL